MNLIVLSHQEPILCGKQCCQMLIEKPAQCPQNKPKELHSSPKYAMTLTVCSESNHHYLIVIAVFVQHTTDLFYKATSNI